MRSIYAHAETFGSFVGLPRGGVGWHTDAVVFFGVIIGWYIALTFGPERHYGWLAAVRSWCNRHIWNRHAFWEVHQLASGSWSLAESQGWPDQAASALPRYSRPLFLLAIQQRGAAIDVN